MSCKDKKYEDLYHQFDAVILGVAHNEFKNKNIRAFLKDSMKGIVYDVKGVLPIEQIDGRL